MKPFSSLFAAALLAGAFCSTVQAQNTPVKNLAPTGDTGPLVAALENARLDPVFVLPMGNGYFDFELKASVTNWTGGTLVYWTASAVDSAATNQAWDASPRVWYTLATNGSGTPADGRVWRQKATGVSIAGPLAENVSSARVNQIVVMPTKISGSSAWMYKGNTHLLWSYCRLTAFGKEVDGNGNAIWNPVVPVDWRAAPLSP